MPTDEEKVIHDILDTNWDINNVAKPTFLYTGDVRHYDVRNPVVKIYLVSTPSKQFGQEYIAKLDKPHVTIDVRTAQRDTALKICDEVIRILELKGKNPGGIYHWLTHTGKRKVTSYSNFHHYVIEAYLDAIIEVTTQ